MSIKIALIQVSKKHTEIIGTFIEYFVNKKFEFDVFYELEKDRYTFLPYYKNLFKKEFNIYHPDELNERSDEYDFYIYTTSSDKVRNILIKRPNQTIYITHEPHHPRPFMIKNIIVSPNLKSEHFNNNITEYILPIYKKYIDTHGNFEKNIFAIIGAIRYHEKDRDVHLLLNVLKHCKNRDDILFYIYMRKKDWNTISRKYPVLKNNPLIKFYPGLTTEKMINHLRKVKYILPLAKEGGWFHWQRLTGSLPLAINLNIPLITDEKIKSIYNLKGCITYKKNIIEVFDNACNISKEDYAQLIVELVEYKKEKYIENKKKLDYIFLKQARPNFEENWFEMTAC
jgi:hypothetical protein